MHKENKNHRSQTSATHIPSPRGIEVTFALEHTDAKEVYLCGDFNQWSPKDLRMIHRDGNGRWEKRVTLVPGRYEYKFIIDGNWIHDAKAPENVPNAHGSLNSVLHVQ